MHSLFSHRLLPPPHLGPCHSQCPPYLHGPPRGCLDGPNRATLQRHAASFCSRCTYVSFCVPCMSMQSLCMCHVAPAVRPPARSTQRPPPALSLSSSQPFTFVHHYASLLVSQFRMENSEDKNTFKQDIITSQVLKQTSGCQSAPSSAGRLAAQCAAARPTSSWHRWPCWPQRPWPARRPPRWAASWRAWRCGEGGLGSGGMCKAGR